MGVIIRYIYSNTQLYVMSNVVETSFKVNSMKDLSTSLKVNAVDRGNDHGGAR